MAGLLDMLVSPFPTAGAIRNKFRKTAWSGSFTPGRLDNLVTRNKFSTFCGMLVSLNYLFGFRKKTSAAPFARADFIDPSGLRGTHVQGFYYNLLKANHPTFMSRPEFDRQVRTVVPGKGSLVKIPDLLTSDLDAHVFEYYEIKPDNAAGLSDANVKLDIIQDFMNRNGLSIYTKGQKYNGCEIEFFRCSVLDLGVVRAALVCRRVGLGVLLYKIKIDADVDIAPALEKILAGMIALAAIEAGAFVAAETAEATTLQTFYRVAAPTLVRVAPGLVPSLPAAADAAEHLIEDVVVPSARRLILRSQ
jgi:hypothetical protein